MKISRRGFLAKGGLILMAAQVPLGALAADPKWKRPSRHTAGPEPKDHVEAWRRFMATYGLEC